MSHQIDYEEVSKKIASITDRRFHHFVETVADQGAANHKALIVWFRNEGISHYSVYQLSNVGISSLGPFKSHDLREAVDYYNSL